MRTDSVLGLVGRTPCLRLAKLFPERKIWAKLENRNAGGSIKDRAALAMVAAAEATGELAPGGRIVEATSGNTGVALAMIAAVRGYRLAVAMPETMSAERIRILVNLGAEVVLTPKESGMTGALEAAEAIVRRSPGAWSPRQFENRANVAAHLDATVPEIVADFPEPLDAVVAGVGTGAHAQALIEGLKPRWAATRLYAVEPERSAILSGGVGAGHRIQGIGPGFIPPLLTPEGLDGVVTVGEEEAADAAREVARAEGLLVGISTGASIAAVRKLTHERVLLFVYDSGERYFSTPRFWA